MIYRKAPLQPARLLLKVVAAGAGALVAVGCSSGDAVGTVPDHGDAAEETGCGLCGAVDSGGMVEGGDEQVTMGVVVMGAVDGGGDDATEEPPPGIVVNPEGGDEVVGGGVHDGPLGVVISPEAGSD
jgi:hypothetical protein